MNDIDWVGRQTKQPNQPEQQVKSVKQDEAVGHNQK